MAWYHWVIIGLVVFIIYSHYNQEKGDALIDKAISGTKSVTGGLIDRAGDYAKDATSGNETEESSGT